LSRAGWKALAEAREMVGAKHWHEFVAEGKHDAGRAGQRADQTWIVRPRGAFWDTTRAKAAPISSPSLVKQLAQNIWFSPRSMAKN
jgi:hypothetical protein